LIYDNGTNVGIGTTSPTSRFQSNNASTYNSTTPSGAIIASNLSGGNAIVDIGVDASYLGYIQSRNITNTTVYNLLLNPIGGNVLIGTTTDSGYKLDVNGTGRFSGNLLSNAQLQANSTAGATSGILLSATSGYASSINFSRSGYNNWYIGSPSNSTSLVIGGNADMSTYAFFTLASTGAATFSSSVSVPSTVSGGSYKILSSTASTASREYRIYNDGYGYGDFVIDKATTQGGATFNRELILSSGNLTLGNTPSTGTGNLYAGAATFSSSVTLVDTLNINGSSGNDAVIRLNAPTGQGGNIKYGYNGTNQWYVGTNASGGGENSYTIYGYTANDFKIITNGTERFKILSTGAATFSSSVSISTSNSSLNTQSSFVSFTNTYPSDYTLASISYGTEGQFYYGYLAFNTITTGYANVLTERMRITQAGLVGIGTTSPTRSFQITKTSTAFINAEGSIVAIGSSDTELRFFGNNTETMTVKSGSVGIGTTSPSAKLEVQQSSDNYGYGYSLKNIAGNTWQWVNGGDNNLYIGYNTSTKFFVSNAGNVGIGTSSPNALLTTNQTGTTGYFYSGQQSGTEIAYWYYSASEVQFSSKASTRALTFLTTDTERMRITSGGNILMGMTTAIGTETLNIAGIVSGSANYGILVSLNSSVLTAYAMRFYNAYTTAVVGSITMTASATAYNTGSDYRLKEDLKEIKGIEKVSAIKVYDFKWKGEESRMDGVLAHELQEVLPYAVHGIKDGKDMQAVDYSKIVPVLVKAIQELSAENTSLINRIEALENK